MNMIPATQALMQFTVARALRELPVADVNDEQRLVLAELSSLVELSELLGALTPQELTELFVAAKARNLVLALVAQCDAELDALTVEAMRSPRYMQVQVTADRLSRVLRGAATKAAYEEAMTAA